MIFIDERHEDFYRKHTASLHPLDRARQVFFYTIGISPGLRNNVRNYYDFKENCIIPVDIANSYLSSTERSTLRLAYNLMTGSTPSVSFLENEDDEDESVQYEVLNEMRGYTVMDIFNYSSEYTIYYLEALKLGFNLLAKEENQ